jgi:hypothetical protein
MALLAQYLNPTANSVGLSGLRPQVLNYQLISETANVLTQVAEYSREQRDKAINDALGMRIAGAAANFRYSELAAEKHALGTYLSGIGQTANEVLMQQIRNNNRV